MSKGETRYAINTMRKHHNILVIEDDGPMCWLLERILGKQYKVTLKTNGWKALEWMSQGNLPSLIISDLEMPSLNGIDLIANIKKSGLYCHIPVLVLSGSLDPEKKKSCLEGGALSFIGKPFEPAELLKAVDDALINRNSDEYA